MSVKVAVVGGSADGRTVEALPPPVGLVLPFERDGECWTEVYVHLEGKLEFRDGHGRLPVMVFLERR